MKAAKFGFMATVLAVFLLAAAMHGNRTFEEVVGHAWVWVFWAALLAGTAIELLLTPRCTLADLSNRKASLLSFVLLFGGCVVAVLDFVLSDKNGILGLLARNGEWVHWVGIVLLAGGFAIIYAGRMALGQEGTIQVCILPKHHLRTNGILSTIRHPIYLGSVLKWVAIAVAFSSLIGLVVNLVACSYFLYRIQLEEKLLADKFGKRYAAYKSKTYRLVPFVY